MKYLDWYMALVAWKEDTRYMGPRWQMADVLRTVTHRRTSKNLCGYWEGAATSIDDQASFGRLDKEMNTVSYA